MFRLPLSRRWLTAAALGFGCLALLTRSDAGTRFIKLCSAGLSAHAQDMQGPPIPGASVTMPPFTMPEIKADPHPLIIQGPAGEIFTFLRTGASTCGRYLLAKAIVPPGGGPIPHVHHWTDEFFVFPEGGFTLFMGTQTYGSLNLEPGRGMPRDHLHLIATKPGDLFYGPRFIVHGLMNNTQESHVMYFIWMPDTPESSILPYFKAVGRTLTSETNPPPVDPITKIRFVTEASRYGINQSSDFYQYVADTEVAQQPMVAGAERRQQFVDMLKDVGDGTHCPK
jgi:mannose-6-phosphate isomerase-like protein (cupin superfamily)